MTPIPLDIVELYPGTPATPNLRPDILFLSVDGDTELVIAYQEWGTFHYLVRYCSVAGGVIALGPALDLGTIGMLNSYATRNYSYPGHGPLGVLISDFLSFVVAAPGSLSSTPTLGPDQGGGDGWIMNDDGLWSWTTTTLYQSVVTGTTIASPSSSPLGFTPSGDIVGRPYVGGNGLGGNVMAQWQHFLDPFTIEWFFQNVGFSSTGPPTFVTPPTGSLFLGRVSRARSAVEQNSHVGRWAIHTAGRTGFLDDNGEPTTFIDNDFWFLAPWDGLDEYLGFDQGGALNEVTSHIGPPAFDTFVGSYCASARDLTNVNTPALMPIASSFKRTLIGMGKYLALIGDGDDTPCRPVPSVGWAIGTVQPSAGWTVGEA